MSGFAIHPDFEATSAPVCDLPLCHVRLQDDARFPWLILIPRVAGVSEIEQLSEADQARLMAEAVAAGRAVRAIAALRGFAVTKLNIAALGNVTPQLHVHVIGRRATDEAWPRPVWNVGTPAPYGGSLAAAVAVAAEALPASG